MTVSKLKGLTFRQRLRERSTDRLASIADAVNAAAISVLDRAGSEISPNDVMRLLSGGQTKTLCEQLITQLSNEAEAEMEIIYNRQIGLLPEGDDIEEE